MSIDITREVHLGGTLYYNYLNRRIDQIVDNDSDRYRNKLHILGNYLNNLTGGVSELWTPANITTSAWYDAADASTITESGGSVSQWDDKSGNDNHVVQGDGALQPTVNGNQIDFVNGQVLTKSSQVNMLDASGEYTMVFVHDVFDPATSTNGFPNLFRNESTSVSPLDRRPRLFYVSENRSFSAANAKSVGATFNTATLTGTRIVSTDADSSFNRVYVDGSQQGSRAIAIDPSTTPSSMQIGDISNQNLTITFKEVLFIAGPRNIATRQKMEGYLAHKWGLTAGLPVDHPYKTNPPTI
jgi:hypothetical protein